MNIIDVNTVYGAGTSSKYKNSPADLENYLISNEISKALSLNIIGIRFNHEVGNADTLSDCADSSVLLPVATINPCGFFGDSGVLEKIKSDGFRAVRFFPDIQNWSPDNMVFAEILRQNSNIGIPFIVNTVSFGYISCLDRVYDYDFPIICSGVSRCNASEFILFAKKHRNVYADCSAFNAYYVLDKILGELGSDRIVFGSGAPHSLAKVSVDFINGASVSREDKEKIFYQNISRII